MVDAKTLLEQKYSADKIKFLGHGSDSAAFAADGYVFRFTDKGRRIYEREAEICHFLQPYITAQLPNIEIHDEQGLFYAKHKMLTGINWSWHKFSWQPKKQHNLAMTCAQFLAQLHSVDVDAARRAVPDIDTNLPYLDFDTVEPVFARFMGPRLLRYFRRRYEKIINQPVDKSDVVIVHLGVKGANSVCNPDGTLKAVYDFGNCGIYERSRDLVLFSLSHNRKFYNQVLREYQRLTGARVSKRRILDLARIEFMWKKRWLYDGQVKQMVSDYFLHKQVAAALVHFWGLPKFMVRRIVIIWFGFMERKNAKQKLK